MRTLTFSWRDMARAPGLAWSFRKMQASFRGITASWAIYILFSYTALMLTSAGRESGIVGLFRHFEFFPCIFPADPGVMALTVWIIGLIAAAYPLFMAATAVSRLAFEDLRGNEVFQVREAALFARENRFSVILGVLIPGAIACVFLLTFLAVGAIGLIPTVGRLIVAIVSLPLFFWAFLGTCVTIVFFFGLLLVPSITACLGEDVLETVIQTFSSVFRQPIRLIACETASVIVTAAGTLVVTSISIVAFHGMNMALGAVMGGIYSDMLTTALYRIPLIMESPSIVDTLIGLGDTVGIHYIVDTFGAPATTKIAGWIVGMAVLFSVTWIVSYAFSIWHSAQVMVYLAVRKHKNGDDLRTKTHVTDFVPDISNGDIPAE